MTTIAEAVVLLKAETAQFTRSMDGVRAKVGSVEKSMNAMGSAVKTAVAGFVTFEAGRRVLQFAATTIMEAEQATAKLEATIRATGGAAGLTAKQIKAMADELERRTLFDDKDIVNAASVLLTFKGVKEQFERTLTAATDLSAQFGGDLQSSVTMLGKALENPLKGLTALTKVGVTFTDAERAKITALVQANRALEAQGVILSALEGQVGGVAAAMGETGLTGVLNRLKDAAEGIAEAQLGFATGGKMPPWMEQMFNVMERLRHDWRKPGIFGIHLADPELPSLPPAIVTPGGRLPTITTTGSRVGTATATAEDEARARSLKSMMESLRAARVEMLEGADAAELLRLKMQGASAEVLALARSNQELRKSFEESKAIVEGHAASVAAMEAAEQERGKALVADVSRAADEIEKRSEQMEEAMHGIWLGWEQGVEGVLTRQIRNFREFAQTILDIWAQTFARMAAVGAANKIMSSLIEPLLGGFLGGGMGGGPKGTVLPATGGTVATMLSSPSPSLSVVNHFTIQSLDPRTTADLLEQQAPTIVSTVVRALDRSSALRQRFGRS